MSTTDVDQKIDYPESDGKPMGETDLHRDWMIRILELLRYRYRGQRVYIASDLLVYYEAGQPTKFIVPDNFVVLDCDPRRRRVFKTWEEQRVPDVVFEVTSRGTSSTDLVDKPVVYERIGVQEYFLYDPTGSYLEPALQGYRLSDATFQEIRPISGRLECRTLGLTLELGDAQIDSKRDRDLVFCDTDSGEVLLTDAEAARAELNAAQIELDLLRRQLRKED